MPLLSSLFSIPKAQTPAPRGTHTYCGIMYRVSITMPGTHDLAKSSSEWLNWNAWRPVTEVTTGTPVGPLTFWPKALSGMLQTSLLESFLELLESLTHIWRADAQSSTNVVMHRYSGLSLGLLWLLNLNVKRHIFFCRKYHLLIASNKLKTKSKTSPYSKPLVYTCNNNKNEC